MSGSESNIYKAHAMIVNSFLKAQEQDLLPQEQTEKILGDALDAMFAGDRAPEDTWPYVEEQLIKILGR